ncbi:MAG TPA: YlbF family regulator [Spirochaetota bacterium]|nr:YlbF family regulator [Spirochaetota bacterium]HOR43646.1 YlbF family regulator [Spirochaetota bacterium]HPK55079.1 YlbF family regulator [Spirochaetota bacterium]
MTNEMDLIIKKAEELGDKISQSEIFIAYKKASAELMANQDSFDKVKRFTRLSAVMREKQNYAEEITQSEMDEVRSLAQNVFDDEIANNYIEVQNAFSSLMNDIFTEIEMKRSF